MPNGSLRTQELLENSWLFGMKKKQEDIKAFFCWQNLLKSCGTFWKKMKKEIN